MRGHKLCFYAELTKICPYYQILSPIKSSEALTAYMQICKCIMKFCEMDKIKFQPAPVYLMMLEFCKVDKISVITANR